MSQPVIQVENLSKAYRIGLKEEIPDTLVGAATGWLKAPLRNFNRLRRLNTFQKSVASGQRSAKPTDGVPWDKNGKPTTDHGQRTTDQEDIIWALKDVSFEVHEGEVVGIIGRNGAGKSTLLKVLSRITEPTCGRAVIRGRVGSLLEVGTGFHPELTGRENIYMNGTILGMKKREIDRKFDEIVDFSGGEKFLDTPTKRYSSGMQVRLAFAVAAHLEPEVLIIDEVLAVGDGAFQKKCLGKMRDVAASGRTVLFVSHNAAALRGLCRTAVHFEAGLVVAAGPLTDILDAYETAIYSSKPANEQITKELLRGPIKGVATFDDTAAPSSKILLGSELRIQISIQSTQPFPRPTVGIGIDDVFGNRSLTVITPATSATLGTIIDTSLIECRIRSLPLPPGHYTITVVIPGLDVVTGVSPFFVVNAHAFGEGRGFHRGICVAPSEWTLFQSRP